MIVVQHQEQHYLVMILFVAVPMEGGISVMILILMLLLTVYAYLAQLVILLMLHWIVQPTTETVTATEENNAIQTLQMVLAVFHKMECAFIMQLLMIV